VVIRSFRNKALRLFYEEGEAKVLPPDSLAKLRAMFAVLDQIEEVEELKVWPLWKVHILTGGRKGTWSLHVSRNWRLTFRVEDGEMVDIDFEDYH
jgi:proteic killer suppression protein